ncbi:hypothetical protein PFICI_10434 [Pestalotiopsis fici W106-1]|uniref:NmrA-like domain-containing protein n=1 Tax=Pestalotiopsis fici (strain W106-1 / CGMCC3.15140) TaxID=1229662 RepID=W3WZ29_PESFW|nr:uncharacterized protein PFICI_10434 [Pestalotiopsis fici W106-1]ETS78372.1 hypothetical protein PFICI_10434 [Pestalotiopsis fici W106-1]
MVKVAIAGGTGAVGRALAETLAQQEVHEAIILSRRESSNDTAVLPTVQANYDDLDSLTKVLAEHKVHTVICAFAITGTSLKKSQMNLIKASAAASSVARFIPTSFSIDYPRDGVDILPPLQDYFDCLDELAKAELEWSVVLNGIFLDYFSAPPIKSYLAPNAFVIAIANNAAAIPGTGDEMVTFTHTFDVARFLVAALDLDKWPKELRISGDEMTFKDFVKLAEEFKGTKFTVYYDSMDKLKKFEITELPQHESLYPRFPKQRFQWFQSIFEQWTVAGLAHIQREGSLNQTFSDLKPLNIRDMLEQCWKKSLE